jgi:hypothetical protein
VKLSLGQKLVGGTAGLFLVIVSAAAVSVAAQGGDTDLPEPTPTKTVRVIEPGPTVTVKPPTDSACLQVAEVAIQLQDAIVRYEKELSGSRAIVDEAAKALAMKDFNALNEALADYEREDADSKKDSAVSDMVRLRAELEEVITECKNG